jgi:hypothetical protein
MAAVDNEPVENGIRTTNVLFVDKITYMPGNYVHQEHRPNNKSNH